MRVLILCCFWNIGGLKDKLEDELFLTEIKGNDIILLAETHIGHNQKISLEGYFCYQVCRPVSGNGRFYGGLAVLIKSHIRPHVSILKNTKKDFQWLKFDKTFFNFQRDLYVCLAYIPPSQSSYTHNLTSDLLDDLENEISLYTSCGDVMVCGDLNARTASSPDCIINDEINHLPVYQDYAVDIPLTHRVSKDTITDARGKSLLETCIGNQIRILNGRSFGDMMGRYTCYTPNGASVVDYTMVSESILNKVLYFHVSDFIATLSDCHSKLTWAILANFNCSNSVQQLKPIPSKFIWDRNSDFKFQLSLQSPDIQDKISIFLNKDITDINEAAKDLNNILLDSANKSLKVINVKQTDSPSLVRKSMKKKRQWFDLDLRLMRKRVISNGKLYSLFPKDPIVRGRYFKLFRTYNKTKRSKERQYKKHLLEQIENLHSENPKEYWNLIDKLKDVNCQNPSDNVKPEDWVNHFKSLGELNDSHRTRVNELESSLEKLEKQPVYNTLDNRIELKDVYKSISKLKNHKAAGLDSICNEMLKCSQMALGPCFLKIFNACLSDGQYPSCWSEGYITPLHKSDNTHDPSNYRGISITNAVGKLFNSILDARLDSYLTENSIIDKCQIGFTKKARTSDHMFVLKTLIDKYCNKKDGNLFACFVDFRKAFDSVIHTGIKIKLLQNGVGTRFYNVIKSMYANNQFCVRITNGLTEYFKVGVGVRQGDPLSPNLFKIFINDLPSYLESTQDPVHLHNIALHCLMYADDLVILSESKTGLQAKLDALENFCNDWCLTININKTKVMIFNKAGRLIKGNFKVQNKEVECVSTYRYLGLYFSASGSFSYAKAELYKKGLKAFYKLCKNILNLQPSVLTSLHLFDHTVKPILLYGCEMWGVFNALSTKFRNGLSLDKIYLNNEPDKLHMKFAKFTLGVHKKSCNFAVMSELGRYPYYIDMIKAMFKFWYRIEHLHPDSLLFNALQCSKNIEVAGNSWFNTVNQLSNLLNLPLSECMLLRQSSFHNKLTRTLKAKYLDEWNTKKQVCASGKLDLYTKVKNNFGLEKYLNILNFPLRRDITRLRISSHKLNIETGRYAKKRVDRADRLCTNCSLGVLGDEIHFLFHCPTFKTNREPLINLASKLCKNFLGLSNTNKYIWLLNCEDQNLVNCLACYVHENLDK